jgi:hypothetical protein
MSTEKPELEPWGGGALDVAELPLLVLVLVSDVSGTTLTGLSPNLGEGTRREVLGDVDFDLMPAAGCEAGYRV